jgi:hypothetical protein
VEDDGAERHLGGAAVIGGAASLLQDRRAAWIGASGISKNAATRARAGAYHSRWSDDSAGRQRPERTTCDGGTRKRAHARVREREREDEREREREKERETRI